MNDSVCPARMELNHWLSPIRLRGLRLLDLQLWCFGYDVRGRSDLLRSYGFIKNPLPARVPGSPEYALTRSPGQRFAVWGYGMHWSAQPTGGLFLRRHAFSPRWTAPGHPVSDMWHVEKWRKARSPRTAAECRTLLSHLVAMATTLAEYEDWIARTQPPEYRSHCIDLWHKESIVPANAIASAWRQLVDHLCDSSSGLGVDMGISSPVI